MPTLSLAIQKGGSGKTTTAINLAAALQQMGRRVLLVDLDPQANLTSAMGLRDELPRSIYHLLLEEASGEKPDLHTLIDRSSGIDLVPASLELAGAELELVSIWGREQLMKRLLKGVQKDYDFILIDCPPAIGMLTVNALAASDAVLLPLQAEFLPLRGLSSFLKHFDTIKRTLNPKLYLLGIVLSRFDGRIKMHQRTLEILQNEFGSLLFETTIGTNIALAQAQEEGVDIFRFDRTAKGALDYLQLADEVLKRLK
jgi:chromosome partitioning protein